jgi:hypothetical protein
MVSADSTDAAARDFPETHRLIKARTLTVTSNAKPPKAQDPKGGDTGARRHPRPAAPQQGPDITRHFFRSLDDTKANGPRRAAMVRSHGCCENRPWMRNTHWGEDAQLLRDPNAACTFALLRTGLQPRLASAGRHTLLKVLEDAPDRPDLGFT